MLARLPLAHRAKRIHRAQGADRIHGAEVASRIHGTGGVLRIHGVGGVLRILGADGAKGAAWLLAVAVLCVSLARIDCLVRHPPCLGAHGERTWMAWAYRHPEPRALFRRIGSQLRPGEPIVVVAAWAEEETYWWRGMGAYFLPDHPIAALSDRVRRPAAPPAPGPARVFVAADGAVAVSRAARAAA